MNMHRRLLLRAALATAAPSAIYAPASAQAFPAKPIRWIVPFAAGGNYDVTSRLVGEAVSKRLNTPVVIENKPGAGGLLGLEAALNAPADGYTVVMGSFNILYVSPYMARRPSLVGEFAPISLLSTVPVLALARTDGRLRDMRQVLDEVRAKPGSISVGHAGNGTSNHLATLRLQANEKVAFNVIPYKGTGLVDLMSGQVDIYVDQLTTSLPHIKSGKLKPLVAFSVDRLPHLPDAPVLKDIGSTPFDGGTTAGLYARAGTPRPILASLNAAVVAVLRDEAIAGKLRELGATPRPTTLAEFSEYMKEQEAGIGALTGAGLLKVE